MYRRIIAGATSQIVEFPVYDSSSSTGALLAGLVYNTASLTAYYSIQNAAGAAVAISLATMTKGTWATSGFVAVDGTNMPGVYQLGIPNLAIAATAGVKFVTIMLKGAANMVPVVLEIELQQEADMAVNVTQILGTAISTPATAGVLDVNVKNIANAAVNTSSAQLGVNVVNAAGTAWGSGAITAGSIASNAITNAKFAAGAIDATAIAADAIGASEFAQAAADKVWSSAARTLTAFSTSLAVSVWDVLTANITTASTIGKKILDWLAGTDTSTPTMNLTKIDGQATAGNNATLNLKQLNIVNNAGSAIVANATGSNGHGISASGNGTGAGLYAAGGATSGPGLYAFGGGSGSGIKALGGTTGNGIYAVSTGGAAGFVAEGNSGGGYGIYAYSMTTGYDAIRAAALTGNANGIKSQGAGSGNGIHTAGGSTGNGLYSIAGASGGHGIYALSQYDAFDGIKAEATGTNGNGMSLTGIGTGSGLYALSGGAYGILASGSTAGLYAQAGTGAPGMLITGGSHGIQITAGGTTLGNGIHIAAGNGGSGISAAGNGAGKGIAATGGATGDGIAATGGATSGSGLNASCVSGDGIKATGGTAGHGINATGAGAGNGLLATGGNSPTTAGLKAVGGAATANGIYAAGNTSGNGIQATGGASGNGMSLLGGAGSGSGLLAAGVSGNGITANGGTAGNGISAGGAGTGSGINAYSAGGIGIAAVGTTAMTIASTAGNGLDISSVGGNGINVAAALSGIGVSASGGDALVLNAAPNYSGIKANGNGTGHGFELIGGLTGHGLKSSGGGTSGDGINTSATAGNGITSNGGGTTGHGIISTGAGAGIGLSATGGATGAGIAAQGGGISGQGMKLVGSNGDGLYCVSAPAYGIHAVSTNFDAIKAVGAAGGHDIAAKELGTVFNVDGVTGAGALEVLKKIVDDNGGADYDATTDSLEKLSVAVDAVPTAAETADAVWDEARAGHTASGSFGQGVASVQGNVTGSVASVTADVGITQAGADKVWVTTVRTLTSFGTLVADTAAAVWAYVTRALTDKANFTLTTGEEDTIADKVWDEAIAGHAGAGSTGKTLTNVNANVGTPVALDTGAATLSGMLTKIADDNGGADFDATTDSLAKLHDQIIAAGTSLTSIEVRDAMKLAPSAGAPAAGSVDMHLDNILLDLVTITADVDAIQIDLATITSLIGTPVALDGGAATVGGMLTKIADDNSGADFNAGTDSLHEIAISGIGLTQQQVRDSMLLAPTPGAPAAGSIDDLLALLQTDITTIGGLVVTIDGNVTTVAGDVASIVAVLPAGAATISSLSMATDNGDGVTLGDTLQLVAAMVDGKFVLNDPVPGHITFYKRDSLTPLFEVSVTTDVRERI